jgi:transposase
MPSVTPESGDGHVVHDVVIGVDTHRDTNVLAAVTTTGRRLVTASFPTTAAGIAAAINWAATIGTVTGWAIEGTGSYGAGLARTLLAAGARVVEVTQPNRGVRRQRGGKTDAIDAEAAARSYLADYATATPKAGDGTIELIRITRAARASAVKARTATMNELKAVLVTAPPEVRDKLRDLSPTRLIATCVALRPTGSTMNAGTKRVLRSLAQRHQHLTIEADAHETVLTELTALANPHLMATFGVGAVTAAALLIAAGDNPERLTTEAGFAALCGVNPIPASSGQTDRMRLNRNGDRQANAALHRIVLVRLAHHPETQAYMAARVNPNGSNKMHIIRKLKRYLARELFPLINPNATTIPNTRQIAA